MKPKPIVALLLLLVIASASFQAGAQPSEPCVPFDEYELQEAVARDPRTSLTWQRCAVGQIWSGTSCVGTATRHTLHDATLLAKQSPNSVWRLPTADELLTVVSSSPSCATAWMGRNPQPAVSASISRPVRGDYLGEFWTTTPETRVPGYGLVVDFMTARLDFKPQDHETYVRLVRGATVATLSTQLGQDVAAIRLRYEDRVADDMKRLAREAAERARRQRMTDNERHASSLLDSVRCEEGRDFAASRPQAERPSFDYTSCVSERGFRTIERSRDPQAIYLAAVKYESEGERSRGKTLYLVLMNKYSSTSFAVKAADRLAALTDVQAIERSNASKEHAIREANKDAERRTEETNRTIQGANRDAASRAYEACRMEESTCYNRGGKNCYRDCARLR